MQSRRDLYQAHRLMKQRVGLALLMGEPDVPESPTRRLTVGAIAGMLIAVLIAAAFGIWGFISPSGAKGLTTAGLIIIEKETGAIYIWQGSEMRPVLNYTSARLALSGNGTITQRVVSRNSLEKYPIGTQIGIPNAPTSLPAAKQLVNGPWSLCLQSRPNKFGTFVYTTSLVGGKSIGGSGLDQQSQAAVVQDDAGYWVIWNQQRHQMTTTDEQEVKGVTQAASIPQVPDSWVRGIPQGGNFDPPPVSDIGSPVSGQLNQGLGQTDARVGQVFRASTSGLYYVLLSDGLARISETQAILLLNEPAIAGAYPGGNAATLHISAAQANNQQIASHVNLYNGSLPATMPSFRAWEGNVPLCAVYTSANGGSTAPEFSIGGTIPTATSYDAATQVSIYMPSASAAIAGDLTETGKPTYTYYLIDDQGTKFPISQKSLISALGYTATPVASSGNIAPVPSTLLALLPAGPSLSKAAAATPVTGTG